MYGEDCDVLNLPSVVNSILARKGDYPMKSLRFG